MQLPASDEGMPWPSSSMSALGDQQLVAEARAAFRWYRQARETPGSHLDQPSFDQLVALQREYIRRFPSGDLSAPQSDSSPGGSGPSGWGPNSSGKDDSVARTWFGDDET